MIFSDSFFIDIKKIHIAHQYTIDRMHKCAYPKGRGQYGLVYVIRGKAGYRCSSGERFTLSPGDLLFLSPDAAYSVATEKDFEHYTVNFSIHEENSTPSRRLLPAREYIERHFAKEFRLEGLAALCNMSVTNFRREWKKCYLESPLQYRDGIRIYYAKEYLRSGYYTVAEIAERCGFEDPSYFTRFFKKHTGLTPGEAKKQYFR